MVLLPAVVEALGWAAHSLPCQEMQCFLHVDSPATARQVETGLTHPSFPAVELDAAEAQTLGLARLSEMADLAAVVAACLSVVEAATVGLVVVAAAAHTAVQASLEAEQEMAAASMSIPVLGEAEPVSEAAFLSTAGKSQSLIVLLPVTK